MSTEITSLNATNATTTTAKMQGQEAPPTNATVVAAQADQVANATTATTTAAKMQGSGRQRPYKNAADFKAKNA